MVEPMSREERDAGNRRIELGFLALVTASPPLITLIGDPTPVQLVVAAGAGFLLGLLLLWYLRRLASEFTADPQR